MVFSFDFIKMFIGLTMAAIYIVAAAAAPSVNSKMSRWTDDDTARWKNLLQPASKYKNKSSFLVIKRLKTHIMNLLHYYYNRCPSYDGSSIRFPSCCSKHSEKNHSQSQKANPGQTDTSPNTAGVNERQTSSQWKSTFILFLKAISTSSTICCFDDDSTIFIF